MATPSKGGGQPKKYRLHPRYMALFTNLAKGGALSVAEAFAGYGAPHPMVQRDEGVQEDALRLLLASGFVHEHVEP